MNRRRFAFFVGLALAEIPAHRAEAQSGYESAIYEACNRYGCNGDQLIRVMYCESGGDPGAVNPMTGDTGLFQFNPSTWYAWGGGDIWNPWEQIELAAWAWGSGLGNHWICQ